MVEEPDRGSEAVDREAVERWIAARAKHEAERRKWVGELVARYMMGKNEVASATFAATKAAMNQ